MKNVPAETNSDSIEEGRTRRYLAANPARRALLARRMRQCAAGYLRRIEALGGSGVTAPLDPRAPEARRSARRRAMEEVALAWKPGEAFPDVHYTDVEQETWRRAFRDVERVQDRWACVELCRARQALALPPDRVPSLQLLDQRLNQLAGFRLEPVPGLVPAQDFFASLARRRFPTTLYVRELGAHAYTPEPDVIHEVLGHAVSLALPRIADLYQRFGVAAGRSDGAGLVQLERVYWHALEFGLVETPGGLRALGAGLLSSCEELAEIERVEHVPWDVGCMAQAPFLTTQPQPRLFVAESFDRALASVEAWLKELGV